MTSNQSMPFKEYSSTLQNYTNPMQLQASQYQDIIKSEMSIACYDKNFTTLEEAAQEGSCPLNANIPVTNTSRTIKIGVGDEAKNINVYEQFYQYKQPGGTIFTDWDSAGVRAVKEDMAVRDLPLVDMPRDKNGKKVSTPSLTLSNQNYVRNNMQNYGKLFLDTSNALNAQSFNSGVNDMSTNSYHGYKGNGPYFEHTPNEDHNGDTLSYQPNQLRVDLPPSNVSVGSWQTLNPAYINPQTGKVNLELLKMTGQSCYTKDFGFKSDVYVHNYEPLPEGLYCSKNTNFVTMPLNTKFKELDTSFSVSPIGNSSHELGTTMSTNLKNYISTTLYEFNKNQINNQNNSSNLSKTDLERYDNVKSYQISQTNGNLDDHLTNGNLKSDMHSFVHRLNIIKYENTYLLLPSMMSDDIFALKEEDIGKCTDKNPEECCYQGFAGNWRGNNDSIGVIPDPNLVNNYCGVNPFNTTGW